MSSVDDLSPAVAWLLCVQAFEQHAMLYLALYACSIFHWSVICSLQVLAVICRRGYLW